MDDIWKFARLDDWVEMVTEKISSELVSKDCYISTDNMLPNRSGIEVASSLPKADKFNHFQSGDTLFSNIRTYFRKVWLAKYPGGASPDVLIFRSKNPSILDSSFLYYIISNIDFVNYTNQTSKGAKMPRGDKEAIKRFQISLPPLIEQKAIASILGALDDKIEVNQKMIRTLEEIARAIFKSWFVDFDPVRAKAESRPTGLSSDIGDLFPDELVASELGKIPKGWKIGKLEDIAKVVMGMSPSWKYI